MNKVQIIHIIICLVFVLGAGAQDNVLENTLIFRLDGGSSNSAKSASVFIDELQKEFDSNVESMFVTSPSLKSGGEKHELSDMYILELDSKDEYEACFSKLMSSENIKYVQPYYLPHLCTGENDPHIVNQYSVHITQTYEAFDISKGDTNIVIGIVDTGVDLDHEDFVDNIKINYNDPVNGIDDDLDGFVDNYRGWDMAHNDPNPECTDSTDHGVLVAGIAAAATNNGKGIAGAGYNTKFLPIKISTDLGYLVAGYQGIVYAADHGCKIINCSWGDTIPNPALQDVIDYAINSRGCIVVAAAGNAGNDSPYYPASYKGVVSVGATDNNDIKWIKSTFGPELDLCAPGVGILTTFYGDKYSSSWVDGTSFASPMVAGAAALVWAKEPSLTNEQVIERLRIGADNIDTVYENTYYKRKLGYGRLNALNALQNDTTPSVRIVNNKIVSIGTDRYLPGDTISMVITLKNLLANASSCIVELVDDSEYTDIIDNFYNAGSLNTFETKSNDSFPFRIALSEDMPADNVVNMSFELTVEGRKDYQHLRLVLNPSSIDVEGEEISTSFTSSGTLGYSNAGARMGTGVVFKDVYNLLKSGGVIMGKNSVDIVSALEKPGFLIKDMVDTNMVGEVLYGTSSYYPDPTEWSDDLIVNQESRLYYDSSYPSSVFHSYDLYNNGSEEVLGVRMGIYADFDLWNGRINKAEYDADLKMVYTYVNSSVVMYAGIMLLSDYDAVPYCFDLKEGGGGGLDITEGFSGENKWFALNNERTESGEVYGANVSTMLSCGSFDFQPQESVKVDYILIAASNLQELKDIAIKAKIEYGVTLAKEEHSNEFKIYPNPANNIINISGDGEVFSVVVYNELGKEVYEGNNNVSYQVETSKYAEGCYLVKLIMADKTVVKKVIINR